MMTKQQFREFREKTFSDLNNLIDKKNEDYTAGGSCFSNFENSQEVGVDRLVGLSIRILDKVQRLKSFCKNGKLEVGGESVEDVFKDLIGYSFIALGMLDENKDKLSK